MRTNERHTFPTISLMINTLNEEKNIADAINSCRDFVDQTIVVDMNSADRTVQIAKSLGAEVIQVPNFGYVEPARNIGLSAIETDWVLILDADERLVSPQKDLRKYLSEVKSSISGFLIPRPTFVGKSRIWGSGWGLEKERQLRLFRPKEIDWPNEIHSVPTASGLVTELPERFNIEILHYCFKNFTDAYSRFNRYSTIEASESATTRNADFVEALAEASQEFIDRYEPELDGLNSLALAFGMYFYRFSKEIKIAEIQKSNNTISLPSKEIFEEAWHKFNQVLRKRETTVVNAEESYLLRKQSDVAEILRLRELLAGSDERETIAREELSQLQNALSDSDKREELARIQLAVYENEIKFLSEQLDNVSTFTSRKPRFLKNFIDFLKKIFIQTNKK